MNSFVIDAKSSGTPFPHYWELCVGSCHAYTALREDYRRQLRRAHDELGFQYVRFHGIFDDDMCVCVEKRDFMGNSLGIVYNFVNTDNIFDFLLDIGMKPFIEIGFMPACLASGTTTCFHYKGNITPPKDFDLWRDFITAFTAHCVERYGVDEVRTWFFEVWNEPNLPFFFDGTKEQYFELYRHTALAVKAVDAQLRVGGPATSINAWIPETIDFCRREGVPLDFISTHHYPSDDPLWRNSDMSIEEFFRTMGDQFGKYERGILRKMTERARGQAGDLPLYYTEWNTSAMCGEAQHDEPYAAALLAKTMADNDGLVEGYSFWTFTDIFEEMSQLPGAFHGGFGLQTVEGVAKPTYRVFELFHELGETRLPVVVEADLGAAAAPGTVEVLATRTEKGLRLIAHNHDIPGAEIRDETVTLVVKGLADLMPESAEKIATVALRRVDDAHANAKKTWLEMGAPQYVSRAQVKELNRASEMVVEAVDCVMDADGSLRMELMVPAHGVCAVDVVLGGGIG